MSGPAIVIFGAAVRPDGTPSTVMRRRVEAAAAFGARQVAPLYVPTGGQGRFGAPEADVMAALLAGFGVADGAVLREGTARNTLGSVRAVRRLLSAQGHSGTVYAATSAYHLPRCVALMRLAGLPARACPPPAFPASERFSRRWFWRLRELLALPGDAVLVVLLRGAGRL